MQIGCRLPLEHLAHSVPHSECYADDKSCAECYTHSKPHAVRGISRLCYHSDIANLKLAASGRKRCEHGTLERQLSIEFAASASRVASVALMPLCAILAHARMLEALKFQLFRWHALCSTGCMIEKGSIAALAHAALADALEGGADFPRITLKRAKELAGSALGHASKMPCATYGISALECHVGGKLAKIPGSICSTCYANPELSANYAYPSVITSHARRLEAIERDPFEWAHGMVELIRREESSANYDGAYFRWHDSGDVQSLEHLSAIVLVCRATPSVRHWLPTKEFGIVRTYLQLFGAFPSNLTVRISAPMIGQPLPESLRKLGLVWSVNHYAGESVPDGAEICSAYADEKGAACNDCRACWDSPRPVSYPVHVAGRKIASASSQMELTL